MKDFNAMTKEELEKIAENLEYSEDSSDSCLAIMDWLEVEQADLRGR